MAVQTNNHHMSCTVLYGDGPRELRNWCRPRPPRRVTGLTHGPIPPSRDTTPPPHATRPTPHRDRDRPATAPPLVLARSARSWRRPHPSRRVRRRSGTARFRPPWRIDRPIVAELNAVPAESLKGETLSARKGNGRIQNLPPKVVPPGKAVGAALSGRVHGSPWTSSLA